MYVNRWFAITKRFCCALFVWQCKYFSVGLILLECDFLGNSMRALNIILVLSAAIFLSSPVVHASSIKRESKTSSVYTEDKRAIMVTPETTQIVIKLKSNPTTGYSWFLREYTPSLIEPTKHVFEAPTDKKLMGAPGYEIWTFRVKPAAFIVPQQTVIRFVYLRPWEMVDNATQAVFKVATLPVKK